MRVKATRKKAERPTWQFCLYVAAQTPRSIQALQNLTAFCEKELSGQYKIEVIDVVAKPQFARTENIVALPTLVRKAPVPERRVVGNLSNTSRMIAGLELKLSA